MTNSKWSPVVLDGRLREMGHVTSGDMAKALGISRQSAYLHLKQLVDKGELVRSGAGRGARYSRPADQIYRNVFPTRGLMEDRVYLELESRLVRVGISENARSILSYAVTEMVNNAIDHSGAQTVEVSAIQENGTLIVEIRDRGIGAFERVRRTWGLPDILAAVQDLSKGKTTTMPEKHSGQGIFFTSKAADVFVLECNGLRWTVDNERGDQALGSSDVTAGTLVRLRLAVSTERQLADVFAAYTDPEDLAFDTSRAVVRLFDLGIRFVSRSEAKRLTEGLEKFDRVIVDFAGVQEVGQGFVDQVFRVWASTHPTVVLLPVNMSQSVEFMVRRGLPKRG